MAGNRDFAAEMAAKVAKEAPELLLMHRHDPTKLIETAGYIRGLNEASKLFGDIQRWYAQRENEK